MVREHGWTSLDLDLEGDLEELGAVPGGQMVKATLLKGATDEGKSVVVIDVHFDDGSVIRGWTTLALFYAMSRAFTPQWEIEVLS